MKQANIFSPLHTTGTVFKTSDVDMLTRIQQLSGVGYWEWYPDNGRMSFSSGARAILSLLPEDETRSRFLERIHQDDVSGIIASGKEIVQNDGRLDISFRWMTSDGDYKLIHMIGERASQSESFYVRGTIQLVANKYDLFFNNLHKIFHSCTDLDSTLFSVVKELALLLKMEQGEVWLVNWDQQSVRKKAVWPEPDHHNPTSELLDDTFVNEVPVQVWKKKDIVQVQPDKNTNTKADKETDYYRLGVPIILDGEILGAIVVSSRQRIRLGMDMRKLLQNTTSQLAMDIQRKQALQQTQAFFKHSPDILVCVSQSGKIARINPACRDMFGYTQDDVIGRSFIDYLHPEDVESTMEKFLANQAGDYSGIVENRFKTKFGEWRWVKWHPSEWNIIDGITYIYGRDVTDEKQTEHELLRFKNVIENFPDGIAIINLVQGCIYVNESMMDMSGYSVDEFQELEGLFDLYTDSNLKEIVPRMLLDGNYWQGDVKLRAKNGELLDIYLSAGPVFNTENELIAIYVVHTDIQEQRQAQKKIRESLREKEILLSEIHHRVKNNLAVVSSLLQLQAMQEKELEINNKLLESSLRIKTIASIHEHLYESDSFSRIDFSKNINSLVQGVVNTLGSNTDIDVNLKCDSVQLNINQAIPCSLIINEVVTNSVKHAFVDRNTGTIFVELTEKQGLITLRIADNGVGLPEEYDYTTEYQDSLGMHIVNLLSKQLDATFNYSTSSGCVFTLFFYKGDSKGIGNADLN